MHFRNVFIHPTVMFRRHMLDSAGFYPEGYTYAEDYAFFWKLIKLKKGFVVNKFLVTCELNMEGISSKNRGKQLAARWEKVCSLQCMHQVYIRCPVAYAFYFLQYSSYLFIRRRPELFQLQLL